MIHGVIWMYELYKILHTSNHWKSTVELLVCIMQSVKKEMYIYACIIL